MFVSRLCHTTINSCLHGVNTYVTMIAVIKGVKMNNSDTIRLGIRRMLTNKDKSQAWLARQAGMKPQQLNRFMKGKNIGLNNLDRVCAGLDCTLTHLLAVGNQAEIRMVE